MRVATWNVNSLKARMERVEGWLDRAQPDVILLQETKLTDEDAPALVFKMRGYDLLHHGEGRWNGVAIASRLPIDAAGIVTNFGDGPVRNSGPGSAVSLAEEDFNPLDEARMLSAVVGGIRVVVALRAERAGRRFAVLRGQARAGTRDCGAGSTRRARRVTRS